MKFSNSLFDAIRLLTLLPVPRSDRPPRAALMVWFPAVGILIGLILTGADRMMGWISPRAVWISPLILSAMWIALTRGLHIDGLADTFDAVGKVGDRARRLEILRDPHVGAFGVVAIVFAIFSKIWMLMSVAQFSRPAALIAAAVCARWVVVPVCMAFPYARPEGLGAAFIGQATWRHVLLSGLITAAVLIGLECLSAPLLITVLICGFGIAWMANRSFGGITGDVLGAVIEVTECAVLAVFAVSA